MDNRLKVLLEAIDQYGGPKEAIEAIEDLFTQAPMADDFLGSILAHIAKQEDTSDFLVESMLKSHFETMRSRIQDMSPRQQIAFLRTKADRQSIVEEWIETSFNTLTKQQQEIAMFRLNYRMQHGQFPSSVLVAKELGITEEDVEFDVNAIEESGL